MQKRVQIQCNYDVGPLYSWCWFCNEVLLLLSYVPSILSFNDVHLYHVNFMDSISPPLEFFALKSVTGKLHVKDKAIISHAMGLWTYSLISPSSASLQASPQLPTPTRSPWRACSLGSLPTPTGSSWRACSQGSLPTPTGSPWRACSQGSLKTLQYYFLFNGAKWLIYKLFHYANCLFLPYSAVSSGSV